MLKLLSQLDGFTSNDMVKVITATNRPDVLDPSLLRSGQFDRKIGLPHPSEDAKAHILKIQSRKMTVGGDVVFEAPIPSNSKTLITPPFDVLSSQKNKDEKNGGDFFYSNNEQMMNE